MPGPSGPPDKTSLLNSADYKNASEFNDAVTALYQAGYEYAFDVPAPRGQGTWVVFQGYKS